MFLILFDKLHIICEYRIRQSLRRLTTYKTIVADHIRKFRIYFYVILSMFKAVIVSCDYSLCLVTVVQILSTYLILNPMYLHR